MKKLTAVLLLLMPVVVFQVVSCNDTPRFANKNAEKGFHLAEKYCQSCHLLPSPDLIDKQTWLQWVLPKMGGFLGFGSLGSGRYYELEHAAMPLEDWNNIVLYYYLQSPKKPLKRKREYRISKQMSLFSTQTPSFTVRRPATTTVQIEPGQRNIFFGDGEAMQVFKLLNGILKDSFAVGKGISNLRITATDYWALSMGVLHPSDEKSGKLELINKIAGKRTVVLDSLQRPVHALYADLNNDQKEDVVVCEFGNTTGALNWYENTGENKYSRHVLRSLPGAVKTEIFDFNKDGKPDLLALMAQADEGFFIYYNEGQGKFREERIVRLPPSYGSNSFQLIDFNKDGYPDIVATNGDNGDYPPVLKAYHGIRIYLNDGRNRFTEKVFLPMHGVGKAVAKDFDEDGDIDIVSISFFPDYKDTPEEGFVYWENKGKDGFQAFSFKDVLAGRWLTMDAGDVDGDSDIDIVLGNTNFEIGNVPEAIKKDWEVYSPSVLILKNTKRQ